MYRKPHPTEPDVFDDRRALADAIFQDQAAQIEAGGKINPHMSALYWLGYRKWGIASSWTTLDSVVRRRRLLNDFRGKPFHSELERHLNGIGWTRPPDREAEDRVALLDAYVEIDDKGTVCWGFRDTPGRDLIFKAFCERFELIVFNGDDHVARVTSTEWDSETTISALGLTDDDYRFQVSAVKDIWWFGELRTRRHRVEYFDFAEIDGNWVELENQGCDWDGEWEGSQREHTAANIARPKSDDKEDKAAKMLADAEAERALYAERKANANMRVVAMAQRNFNGDKLHPDRNYGANWFRVLWALGYRPRVWHGSLVQPEPTEPFTSADARRELKIWSGWQPFVDELERLEKMEGIYTAPDQTVDTPTEPYILPATVAGPEHNGKIRLAVPSTWTGKGRIQFGGGVKTLDFHRFRGLVVGQPDGGEFIVAWDYKEVYPMCQITLEWQPMAGSRWVASDGGSVDPFVLSIIPL